jgi:hypothetical protein
VLVDSDEDVLEVFGRVDLVRLASRDQRVETGEAVARLVVADEEEVLSAQRDSTKCRFSVLRRAVQRFRADDRAGCLLGWRFAGSRAAISEPVFGESRCVNYAAT